MRALQNKNITVGITGGIAVFKAAVMVRDLIRAGANVSVVITNAGAEFVSPLTFSVLTGRPCIVDSDMFRPDASVSHIEAGRNADLIVIAPATANTIARIAQGFADNMLTAAVMAASCPVLIVPSMHVGMWTNPIVQKNLASLPPDRYSVMDPEEGLLACGDQGPGRFPDGAVIVQHAARLCEGPTLAGKTLVVTAGPTMEPLDAVRVLTNPSSGRMGLALAWAAWRRRAQVRLILGHTQWSKDCLPFAVTHVQTAQQMLEATRNALIDAHGLLMSAAVADERPVKAITTKLPKKDIPSQLELEATPDILMTLQPRLTGKVVLAFAAETGDLVEAGRAKQKAKKADFLFANPVGQGRGFGDVQNEGILLGPGNAQEEAPLQSKEDLADWLLDRIAARMS